MGTCRMGPHPDRSVVDLRGRVHEVERLFVADSSLFPTCTGVNPQVSIMAFATRIAQHVGGIVSDARSGAALRVDRERRHATTMSHGGEPCRCSWTT